MNSNMVLSLSMWHVTSASHDVNVCVRPVTKKLPRDVPRQFLLIDVDKKDKSVDEKY